MRGVLSALVEIRVLGPLEVVGAPVTVGRGVMLTLVFSPDSRLLAGVDITYQGRLIDVPSRQPVGDPFLAIPAEVSFSPGSTVLAMSGTSTALWDLDPTVWRERACEIAGRNLTPAVRREYLPNDPDPPRTCPHYPG